MTYHAITLCGRSKEKAIRQLYEIQETDGQTPLSARLQNPQSSKRRLGSINQEIT